ncbi:MAG: IS1595 family transposase [Sphingomonadaceae bacterium]|nr:IS1595 family transposase [Sphingomonadaceae bacterium]
MSVLSKPYFHDEAKAFTYLESIIWSEGVVCPHCGVVGGRVYDLSDVRGKASKKSPEGAVRHGLKKCGECRKQFTVKVGTVFEHGRMPLHKMLQAVYLMTSSKKGISAHQLHRVLEITYKSAWFLAHRIREAMRDGQLAPFGGGGNDVQADETYYGNRVGAAKNRGPMHKMRIVSLLDKRTGKTRSVYAPGLTANEVAQIVSENVHRESILVTDESPYYKNIGKRFVGHVRLLHGANQYVKNGKTTNDIEGFFSIFKRGMRGVYQHCSERHLHRYLAEFDFRYSNRQVNGIDDYLRSIEAMKGISGKRLTYRPVNG